MLTPRSLPRALVHLRVAALTALLAACAPDVANDRSRGSDATTRGAPAAGEKWKLVYATEVPGRQGLDIFVVDVPGGTPRRVAGVAGRNDFSPSWSPGGKSIVFRRNPARGDEGEIMVVDAARLKTRNLTRSPRVADWSPVWHPAGASIAFFSFPGGRGDIWLMRANGRNRRRLTRVGSLNEYPTFRPDGSRLAFQSHRVGNFDIYAIDLDGRNERRLTNDPRDDKWPAWSPDGQHIAFMSDRDGSEDVFVMRSDGSEARNLTRTPRLSESHPAWAPDGRLTFTRHDDSGPIELWVVDADGTGTGRLATEAQPVFVYDWLDR